MESNLSMRVLSLALKLLYPAKRNPSFNVRLKTLSAPPGRLSGSPIATRIVNEPKASKTRISWCTKAAMTGHHNNNKINARSTSSYKIKERQLLAPLA
jgi:hypothetical protein